MNNALFWLILLGIGVNIVLSTILLNRAATSAQGASKDLREELRGNRDESRAAARELREEVSANLRSTGATLSATLESVGNVQHLQLEGMTTRLKELADSNQTVLNSI